MKDINRSNLDSKKIDDQKKRAAEKKLIAKAVEGDTKAGTEIVLQHQGNVYNLALRMTGNEHEAESVLQETFLKVFEKLPEFRGESSLGTWIHRIATNIVLMQLRKRKGKYFVPIEDENRADEDNGGDIAYVARSFDRDPLELTLNEELKKSLEKAIIELPPNLRTAFVLKDMEDHSMAEIAEQTGKSISAIKADLHRARVKLRKKLAEFIDKGASNG
ncbi:MAG: sigma-70 family RNA polymerase sigma factor [Candidatus Electryonea clarkiae]|nr:sigma-70 family RNA polymerase sigma factor [Candidatus Electryonea clarkiae]MDP8286459.1 sigma-70 family RNA polymerase sigma factor [Candidatus Electryonea clarkiae]